MKFFILFLLTGQFCIGQDTLRAKPEQIEFTFKHLLCTIDFFSDSTYKTKFVWDDTIPAPKGYYQYIDSGKYSMTKYKIKLYSAKKVRNKEDYYIKNDEINLMWDKGGVQQTIMYFSTTNNIRYGKKRKVSNDTYWKSK